MYLDLLSQCDERQWRMQMRMLTRRESLEKREAERERVCVYVCACVCVFVCVCVRA